MSRLKSQLLARTKSHQTPRLSFVLNLPAEVLATVFHEVFATFSLHEDGFKDALNLGLVSKEWRAVLLSHFVASLHCRVSLTSLKDVTAFANLVKGTVGHWLTNDLSICLPDPTSSTQSKLTPLLKRCVATKTLELSLGGNQATDPFVYVFGDGNLLPFQFQPNLTAFIFSNEIWLSTLCQLLPLWPHLRQIELEYLRSDCHSKSDSFDDLSTTITHIVLHENTLPAELVCNLLQNRRELEYLQLRLPGVDEPRVFQALELVASKLVNLRLTNRFKKVDSSPSERNMSPLLSIVRLATKLQELEVSTSLASAKELIEIWEVSTVRKRLRTLRVGDGLREAVQVVIKGGKLKALEEVVFVGPSKKAIGTALEKACQEMEIEWRQE